MRNTIVLATLLAVLMQACSSGPTPEEEAKRAQQLQAVRDDASQKIAELEKRLLAQIDALRIEQKEKLADLEKRFADIMQMEQRSKAALEEATRMTKVTEIVNRLLEAQQNVLKDQLRAMQDLQKEFQK